MENMGKLKLLKGKIQKNYVRSFYHRYLPLW